MAAGAGDANDNAGQQPASEGIAVSAPRGATPTSDTPSTSDAATDAPASNSQASVATRDASPAIAMPSQKTIYATSFDCSKAVHEDEITICGDSGLAAMDTECRAISVSAEIHIGSEGACSVRVGLGHCAPYVRRRPRLPSSGIRSADRAIQRITRRAAIAVDRRPTRETLKQ